MAGSSVVHDSTKSQFYISLDGGSRAVLDYQKSGDVLDMYHTEVPSQYRGQGIAGRLAETAFNYAVDNKYRVQPTCTFIQKFISQNRIPKYLALLVTKGR